LYIRLFGARSDPQRRRPLSRLKTGNEHFASDNFGKKDIGASRREELAKGQHPFAAILSCADSRVPPEHVFDQGLGDLFVVRVAGNVTDPALLGSLEYAVEHLHVPVIVVLGHEECGAVKAALGTERLPGNLGVLIQEVYTGKADTNGTGKNVGSAVKANVLHQVGQLTAKSPVIKEFVDSQRIKVAAGVYSLKTGKIDWLELSKK